MGFPLKGGFSDVNSIVNDLIWRCSKAGRKVIQGEKGIESATPGA